MKTIVKYEGQRNTIQGECKPREAMEILGLNPKEWKVTAKEITDKTATYTIERVRSLALVPKPSDITPKQTEKSFEPLTTPDLLTGTSGTEPHPTIIPAEINVYREELQAVLKVICDVTAKKGLMPVLSMVKIEVTEETITITATDLEVSYTATIPAMSTGVTSFLVSADTFSKEVRALGDEVEDVFMKVTADSIQINGRCILPASVTHDFPEIEPLPEGSITASLPNLIPALKCVLPAVSTDETRYLLTGVCFDLASGFIVATDGFRLHKAAVDTCKCPSFILLKRA
ncbi:MAG TPA: DNA polymerase III subunit beta, partial [Syntrophorhabdaceae bacterium]|nr:DNA polymerase III subunit beta [Syntrophorhabdaceae bacterium]